MNTMVFEEWAARGKKHFRREDSTLDGILQTPKRRIHVAAKPPVYKQPKNKKGPAKKKVDNKTQIVFTEGAKE